MFRSFFLAGFECATGYNAQGQWIDQIAATHHDQHADEDYRRLREAGILAAREAIRWPLVDRASGYDFSCAATFADAGRRHGIELIWDLFHYGYPDGLDPFSDGFVARFAEYCHAAGRWVRERTDGTCWFTPVNEPSFFSWAGGHVGRFAPYAINRAWDLKVQFARAGIAGIDAIRAACPGARFINVDPICHVVAQRGLEEEMAAEVARFNASSVFESWDMLAGTLLPELGGSRAHLDVVGINYYWTNQWELGRDCHPLAEDDPRRVPLRELVRRAWHRYGGDLVISETGHVDERRPEWMQELGGECDAVLDERIPLRGVCLYPILGMPEWHAQDQWTRMGLWDVRSHEPVRRRDLCEPMWQAFRWAARRLEPRHALAVARAAL